MLLLSGQGGVSPLRQVQTGTGKAGKRFLASHQQQSEPGVAAGEAQHPGPCRCPCPADPLCGFRREPAELGVLRPLSCRRLSPADEDSTVGLRGCPTPQKD